jgi:hypothetical protein
MNEVCKEITSLQQLSCPFVVSFVESYLYERKTNEEFGKKLIIFIIFIAVVVVIIYYYYYYLL